MNIPVTTAIDYSIGASPESVARTVDAIRARGIKVTLVDTSAEALAKVHDIIPAGATIMMGMSQTLQEIGLEAQLINKQHPWVNLKDDILTEKDPLRQSELRRKSTLSPWYLGSVQAIAQTGEILVASSSGSQLPAYTFTSSNLVWVAGTQKIVPTLEAGLQRIHDYSLPLEHVRMQKLGYPGAFLAKILIILGEHELSGRNLNLILVNEPVGA